MRQEQQQQGGDIFQKVTLAGQWALGLNQSNAMAWLLLSNRFRTFGCRFIGMNAFFGLVIFYPCFPLLVPFEDASQLHLYARAWYGFLGLCFAHRLASMFFGTSLHPHDIGVCRFGTIGELAMLGVVSCPLSICCPPLGWLLVSSYVSKQLLIQSINVRYRIVKANIDGQRAEAEEIQRVIGGG